MKNIQSYIFIFISSLTLNFFAMEEREPLLTAALQLQSSSYKTLQQETQKSRLQLVEEQAKEKIDLLCRDRTIFFSQLPKDIHGIIAQKVVYAQHGKEYAEFRNQYQLNAQQGFLAALQHENPFICDDAHIISMITDEFDTNKRDEYSLTPLVWSIIFRRACVIESLLSNGAIPYEFVLYEIESAYEKACEKKEKRLANILYHLNVKGGNVFSLACASDPRLLEALIAGSSISDTYKKQLNELADSPTPDHKEEKLNSWCYRLSYYGNQKPCLRRCPSVNNKFIGMSVGMVTLVGCAITVLSGMLYITT